VHDFLTVGAPAPLQDAAAVGYSFDDAYYAKLAGDYREKREFLSAALLEAGFRFATPDGAYFIMADFSDLDDRDDVAFAKWLTKEVKVATVPGSSFYRPGAAEGKHYIRFAFCKKRETLEQAVENLSRLKAIV
jgi:aminotransferase